MEKLFCAKTVVNTPNEGRGDRPESGPAVNEGRCIKKNPAWNHPYLFACGSKQLDRKEIQAILESRDSSSIGVCWFRTFPRDILMAERDLKRVAREEMTE